MCLMYPLHVAVNDEKLVIIIHEKKILSLNCKQLKNISWLFFSPTKFLSRSSYLYIFKATNATFRFFELHLNSYYCNNFFFAQCSTTLLLLFNSEQNLKRMTTFGSLKVLTVFFHSNQIIFDCFLCDLNPNGFFFFFKARA